MTLRQVRAFAGLIWALRYIPLWLLRKPDSVRARTYTRSFFAAVSRSFGIGIEMRGNPSRELDTMFIMNHVSWADIPVVMAIVDADFVAKSDMLGWPVIGPLARRLNPVFVARDQARGVHDQVEAIRARLKSGRSVILCAEGTTSNGGSILPFRTSLFAAADAATVIQPVVLRYLGLNGGALALARQREVAWIDDDELLAGAARLAREATLAQLEFLPPITPNGVNRKQLANAVHREMLNAYAAAPNRPR